MVQEYIMMKMEVDIKANLKTISLMDREHSLGLIIVLMKENS